nr:glutaredoxin [Lachnospiraceae bacterium]
KASLDANGAEYDFRDIGSDLKALKEFIRLRDTATVFDGIRGTGAIGIPAIVSEDDSIIIDWEGYLEDKGYKVVQEGTACGIDGKGC